MADQARILPHSFEAEQSVLGCIIIDSELAGDILPELKEEDFYAESSKIVFQAMKRVFSSNRPIDMVTLTYELDRAGETEKIGGIAYLTTLATSLPSSANWRHYVDMVKRDSMLRKLIRGSQEVIDHAFSGEESKSVLEFAEKFVFDLSMSSRSSFPTLLGDSLNEVVEKFETVAKDANAFKGLTTGFAALNRKLNGLHRSDLILVAARPGEGKTSFAMNIVENAALLGGARCAVFSLEMPAAQIAQRMLCGNARVSMEAALKGKLELSDWDKLWESKRKLDEAFIYIDDTASITPADIMSKCRRLKAKGGLDLIMIDYVQLMSSGGSSRKGENRQQEIADISRSLKLIAREIDVPVIALSQLSRAIESREGRMPQLSDLRDSGAIEQDADIVLFIHNPAYASAKEDAVTGDVRNGPRDIIVAKHRNGSLGTVRLNWVGEYTRFEDVMSSYADSVDSMQAPPEFKRREKTAEPTELPVEMDAPLDLEEAPEEGGFENYNLDGSPDEIF